MPRKKKRWAVLRDKHPEIFQRAIDVGFISPSEDWEESFGACPFDALDAYIEFVACDSVDRFDEVDEVNKILRSIDDEDPF